MHLPLDLMVEIERATDHTRGAQPCGRHGKWAPRRRGREVVQLLVLERRCGLIRSRRTTVSRLRGPTTAPLEPTTAPPAAAPPPARAALRRPPAGTPRRAPPMQPLYGGSTAGSGVLTRSVVEDEERTVPAMEAPHASHLPLMICWVRGQLKPRLSSASQ
jgi:hypothetical protein